MFLDMVDVRGDREHAWAHTQMDKLRWSVQQLLVECFSISRIKVYLHFFWCLMYSAEEYWEREPVAIRMWQRGHQSGVMDRRRLHVRASDLKVSLPRSLHILVKWPRPFIFFSPVSSMEKYVIFSFNNVMFGKTDFFSAIFPSAFLLGILESDS